MKADPLISQHSSMYQTSLIPYFRFLALRNGLQAVEPFWAMATPEPQSYWVAIALVMHWCITATLIDVPTVLLSKRSQMYFKFLRIFLFKR